jgi:hypothetical protein
MIAQAAMSDNPSPASHAVYSANVTTILEGKGLGIAEIN